MKSIKIALLALAVSAPAIANKPDNFMKSMDMMQVFGMCAGMYEVTKDRASFDEMYKSARVRTEIYAQSPYDGFLLGSKFASSISVVKVIDAQGRHTHEEMKSALNENLKCDELVKVGSK